MENKPGSACPCCHASVDAYGNIKHDELCSYNNTREAVKEFPPTDFILGVQNPVADIQLKHYRRMIGKEKWTRVNELASDLLSGDEDRWVQAISSFDDRMEFNLSRNEVLLLMGITLGHRPGLYAMIRNFLLYKAALIERRSELRDDIFRFRARREVLDKLFFDAFISTPDTPKESC